MWWLLLIAAGVMVLVKLKRFKRLPPQSEPQLLEAPKACLYPVPQDASQTLTSTSIINDAVPEATELQADHHSVAIPPLPAYYHWEPVVLFWGLSDRITWKPYRSPQTRRDSLLRWGALVVAVLAVGAGLWLWLRS